MRENVVETFCEVNLADEESFLKVQETLTRIGISNDLKKELWQSCHILHKRGKYYIVHFKEMFALDGRESTFSKTDEMRRNKIASLLEEWGLVKIVNPDNFRVDFNVNIKNLKILSFSEKENWTLRTKYSIGNKKKGE